MSTTEVVYFLRLSGRFGSSTTGALAGGALPNSTAGATGAAKLLPSFDGIGSIVGAGAGATGAVYTGVGCGTSGEGVIHCGCAGTLTSGAVPTPEIFPLQSLLLFLYHV